MTKGNQPIGQVAQLGVVKDIFSPAKNGGRDRD